MQTQLILSELKLPPVLSQTDTCTSSFASCDSSFLCIIC